MMELNLSAEIESKLARLATQRGSDPTALAQEAIERFVEYDASFIEAIEEGRACARQGNLLDHEAVVERIETLLST